MPLDALLAEMIHRALTDPTFRLALEAGTIGATHPGLGSQELEALSEVMHHYKGVATKKLLDDVYAFGIIPDWREE